MKDKILVTGAAGFIGSHLMEYLVKKNYDIIGIDDFSGGFKRNVDKNWNFYYLDLGNRDTVKKFIDIHKPQILIHLAANAREGASQFQPFEITLRNYYAYMNVLEQMIKYGLKKTILFSSMSIYGNQKPPFSENMHRMPEDIYGINKTAMEHSTEILAKVHRFKYVIIRPHNNFGTKQSMNDLYRNVIAIFMNRIMRSEPIYIYGDGEQLRAFSYINDSLPCYERCLDDKFDFDKEIFNIGGKVSITINELVEKVLACFPSYKSKIVYLPERPCEVKDAYCTWQKSEDLLGYEEKYTLDQGIAEMVQWAKQLGPQEWTKEKLEIVNEKTPVTWTMKR